MYTCVTLGSRSGRGHELDTHHLHHAWCLSAVYAVETVYVGPADALLVSKFFQISGKLPVATLHRFISHKRNITHVDKSIILHALSNSAQRPRRTHTTSNHQTYAAQIAEHSRISTHTLDVEQGTQTTITFQQASDNAFHEEGTKTQEEGTKTQDDMKSVSLYPAWRFNFQITRWKLKSALQQVSPPFQTCSSGARSKIPHRLYRCSRGPSWACFWTRTRRKSPTARGHRKSLQSRKSWSVPW